MIKKTYYLENSSQQQKYITERSNPNEQHLIKLKDRVSGETLVNAAEIRNFQAIIDIDKNLQESELLNIRYRRRYRSLYFQKGFSEYKF